MQSTQSDNAAAAPKRFCTRNLLFLVLAWLLVFAAAEGFCRAYDFVKAVTHKQQNMRPNLEYNIHPYLFLTLAPNQRAGIYSINSRGYRGPEFPQAPATNTIRIIITGGSTAFGRGVEYKDTIADLLEKKLNASRPPGSKTSFEVLNMAVPSYDSTRELFIIETQVLDLRPAAVVSISCTNDLVFPTYYTGPWKPYYPSEYYRVFNSANLHQNPAAVSFSELAQIIFYKLSLHSSFFKHFDSVAARIARPRKGANAKEIEQTERALDEQAPGVWARNMSSAAQILKAHNIMHFVVIQPSLFASEKTEMSPADKRKIDVIVRITGAGKFMKIRKRYENAAAALKAEAGFGSNFSLLDASSFSSPDKRAGLFTDHCHLTPAGNGELADRIYKQIMPTLKIHFPLGNTP